MDEKVKNVKVKKTKSEEPARAMTPAGEYGFPSLREELDRFFGGDLLAPMLDLRRFWERSPWTEPGGSIGATVMAPRADLSESDKEYTLTLELPGMDEKDIELNVTDKAITLTGEKREEKETKEKDFHLTERRYGSIRRTLPLPSGVDLDKVSAVFSKGVLSVKLPKLPQAQTKARKVQVKAG